MPSGAGLGGSGVSRVMMRSKSAAVRLGKFNRERSMAARPFLLRMPNLSPKALNSRTTSSAPGLGCDSAAARSSNSSRRRAQCPRSWASGSDSIHSRTGRPAGQPMERAKPGRSREPGCVSVPSKSKSRALIRNALTWSGLSVVTISVSPSIPAHAGVVGVEAGLFKIPPPGTARGGFSIPDGGVDARPVPAQVVHQADDGLH